MVPSLKLTCRPWKSTVERWIPLLGPGKLLVVQAAIFFWRHINLKVTFITFRPSRSVVLLMATRNPVVLTSWGKSGSFLSPLFTRGFCTYQSGGCWPGDFWNIKQIGFHPLKPRYLGRISLRWYDSSERAGFYAAIPGKRDMSQSIHDDASSTFQQFLARHIEKTDAEHVTGIYLPL